MNPQNFTEEQRKDIEERTKKAQVALKELQLQPACFVTPINLGDDTFALKTIAFLQDLKFTNTVSPIQKDDISTT